MTNEKIQPYYKNKLSYAGLKYLFYIDCTKLGWRIGKASLASAKVVDSMYLLLGGGNKV